MCCRDVLQQYHPLALRWFLVTTHYRAAINYTQRALEEASDRIYYIYQTLADADAAVATLLASDAAAPAPTAKKGKGTGGGAGAAELQGEDVVSQVMGALVDDLNTPAATSALTVPLKAINDLLTTKAGKKAPNR